MENCPECGTKLVYNDLPFDEMSEGQQANVMAGFIDKKCPNCNIEIEDSP